MTTVLQTTAIENGIKLFFTLKNTTEDAITYTFNTSQRFEVEVKNSEGTTVYRYSTHRMFTQVLGKLNLDKNEEKTFEATVTPLKPGDYIIRVWLTANEDQPEARSHFSIN
ncbi:hypothetical protein JOD43_000907 [Pullulanibacillus pueri]|nr:BsuPI-related putative proteinase inhibitor [Pullulanibacillus pueri]MBM7680743.1 hypothetical protein [Pullulanibacillus pueri]